MRLSQIRDQRVDLAIDVMGDVLNVVYNPTYVTPEIEDELTSVDDSHQMAQLLSGMIVEWDLLEDDTEKPVATDEKTLRTLPTIVLALVVGKIAEHTGETVRAEGKASRGTSRRKA